MASSAYSATEEITNANRISRLLMGPCTDQFRDLLRFYIEPSKFSEVIQKKKSIGCRSNMSVQSYKLILPKSGSYKGNYDDMDIALLYTLLRNICGIKEHRAGWGEKPQASDRSVSANIERIRLARNQCGHSTGGLLSNADFNQIWSSVRASVVDLDLELGNGNKYEKEVDFIRHDTMDPVRDQHYRDQLIKQAIENQATIEEVNQLKRSLQDVCEQNTTIQRSIQDTQTRMLSFETRNIPLNIKKQHLKLLDSWQKEDLPFHEVHSFQDILEKVQSKTIVTIIGGPGSGKTAMIRHIALLLQTEFEIVPIACPSDIIQYGQEGEGCKQLFTFDDVMGVFGIERGKYIQLEDYKESILNVLGAQSKILFTCRKSLYKEAEELEPFVLSKECIVDLEDNDNQLTDQDREHILENHCRHNDIIFPMESPTISSNVGKMMFPLLCKLFCSDSKYQALGMKFFENPKSHILREINLLQKHKRIQYAALVLCMFCQNRLTIHMLKKKEPRFMEIREVVFESCRVNGRNSEIQDALFNMENTFTSPTSNGYSLIHDSVYEVLAYHYGNKNQEDMLKYMSSSFVAKKIIISDSRDQTDDLLIKLREEHYKVFAERLLKDLTSLELHDVFMNKALKDGGVFCAFIDALKRISYPKIKELFFSKQEDTSKIVSRSKHVGDELEIRQTTDCELDRQNLLVGGVMVGENASTPNVRIISWVIYYGHSKLLQYLFEQILKNQESIQQVLSGYIPNDHEENDRNLTEQTRLLTLSCYSGNLEVVKLLLKHCDTECINNKSQYTCHMFYDHRYITPLTAACARGHQQVVDELIHHGASIDQQDEWGTTALYVAAESGHLSIVESLVKAGADVNACDMDDITPLFAASQTGYLSVVDFLLKHGGDCNKPDIYKMSPLYVAARNGNDSIVDLLIQHGANCNQSDMGGRSPLYAASRSGHMTVVEALINHGADVNRCSTDGKSPLSVALKHGQMTVANLLMKHGAKK